MEIPSVTIDSINYCSLFKYLFDSLFGPIVAIIGSFLVGKQLGYFNNQLTTNQNQAMKKDERLGELEEMITLQQIKDIVDTSNNQLRINLTNQSNGLGSRIDELDKKITTSEQRITELINKQRNGLGSRIGELGSRIGELDKKMTNLQLEVAKANGNIGIIITAMNSDRQNPIQMLR